MGKYATGLAVRPGCSDIRITIDCGSATIGGDCREAEACRAPPGVDAAGNFVDNKFSR